MSSYTQLFDIFQRSVWLIRVYNPISARPPASPALNLHHMPILILKIILSYLDVGHILPLVLVNKTLYWTLLTEVSLWYFLLRERLHIEFPENHNAFNHLMLLSHTICCGNCYRMDGTGHVYFDEVWRMPLCNHCRWLDEYRTICATAAKEEYFLDDNNFL
jgi:hypothetical protein